MYLLLMLAPEEIAPEALRPIRRVEFERMVEIGLFEDERVELLRGFLVEMSPQGAPHVEVIRRLNALLVPAVAGRALVQVQGSFALSDDSEPEPDLALIEPGDYSHALPSSAHLVIEVACSSRNKDLGLKATLYAAAEIAEYWVIDVDAREVVVHQGGGAAGWERVLRVGEDAELAPARFPDVVISVRAILPTPA